MSVKEENDGLIIRGNTHDASCYTEIMNYITLIIQNEQQYTTKVFCSNKHYVKSAFMTN